MAVLSRATAGARGAPLGSRWDLLRTSLLVALGLCGCHAVFDGDLGVVRCETEGGYGPPACPPHETCVDGTCGLVGAPLGAQCGEDGDCRAPGWCLDPAKVGEAGTARCSKPCCASTDCGPPSSGQVCFAPGGATGGICWPHDALGRERPGASIAGEPCAAGRDCRSGLCDETCRDLCCGDASCAADRICRVGLAAAANQEGWSCGLPPTTADGWICEGDADCRRGICASVTGLEAKLCAEPCCGSSECGSIELAGEVHQLACARGDDGLRGCVLALPAQADGAVGAPCKSDETCRSGFCLDDGGARYCSDLCCDDASCGDMSQFVCRVGIVQGFSALRCIRK